MISHLLQIYDSVMIYSMGKFTKGNNSTSMWLHRLLYHFFIENVSFSPDFSLACYPCFWELYSSKAGEGNGSPLQGSCLEDPRDGGAWRAAVYGVAQSRARLKRVRGSSSSSSKTRDWYILLGRQCVKFILLYFKFTESKQLYHNCISKVHNTPVT